MLVLCIAATLQLKTALSVQNVTASVGEEPVFKFICMKKRQPIPIENH
jgi:hypothetical protein